eukprot:2162846-Amphidinium_carterae.1
MDLATQGRLEYTLWAPQWCDDISTPMTRQSSDRPKDPQARRAGWAVVGLNEHSQVTHVHYGSVPLRLSMFQHAS